MSNTASAQEINQLLAELDPSTLALPSLGAEPSATGNFLGLLKDYLRELLEGTFKSIDFDIGEFLVSIYPALEICVVVLAVVFVFRLLHQVFFARARGGTNFRLIDPVIEQPLSEKLEQALSLGHYAEALRIRWRLFLFENGVSSSKTPTEYFKSANTSILDSGMFGKGARTREDYLEKERFLIDGN
jgi:hypothetical protein